MAKRSFDSMDEAVRYIDERKIASEYNAYKCYVCNKWHIGHKIIDNGTRN